MLDVDALDFQKGHGLVTVVAQHAVTGAVLMVAFADREAVDRTLETGELYLRSRTRGLWHRGATTGHVLRVLEMVPDCDGDALLARVQPAGPVCHTGAVSCFAGAPADILDELDRSVDSRDPEGPSDGYTRSLLGNPNRRLKKLGEEAVELAVACSEGPPARVAEEAADLIYHALVAARAAGATLADVRAALAVRRESR